MKTSRSKRIFLWPLFFSLLGCAAKNIPPPETEDFAQPAPKEVAEQPLPQQAEERPSAAAQKFAAAPAAGARQGVAVDLGKAAELLKDNRLDDLLDLFSPEQLGSLTPEERRGLAALYFQAASQLRQKLHDYSYSALFCERGLMLDEKNQELLRLQIENYLSPELRIYGGAEELAEKLLAIDPENQLNQLLRGKVAFEQAEWDVAIGWLEKAARVGRTESSAEVKDAWKLLDLARARVKEIKSSLSMTMELERRLASARERLRKMAEEGEIAELESRISPTPGGDIVLYMTSWCGYCRKTRELLKSLNVPFKEKDIEKDKEAAMEVMQLATQKGVEITGVPVVRIGNELVLGYNADRIKKLVEQLR